MQASQYATDMMENPNVSQHKSKKKLRFFSKSKKRNPNPTNYPNYDQQQCYCEDCMRTVHQNNHMLTNQQMTQYYYPTENQMSRTLSLSPSEQRFRDEPQFQSNRIERIYPPPQQFPCECTNCKKKRGQNLTTELLPLDTQMPLQMMSDSALLCNIL